MCVPIIIISYNNYRYVENTIQQIKKLNESYVPNIIVMDNCSNDEETIKYLENLENLKNVKVIRNTRNDGPWVSCTTNSHVWETMPEKYILTDPDLEFNSELPSNFIEQLVELSDKYNTCKIGFALKLDDFDKMYQGIYCHNQTILQWESQFWPGSKGNNKIESEIDYELYYAPIDTTFCLISKNNQNEYWFSGKDRGQEIRVGGKFLARHLPWYIDYGILTTEEKYHMHRNQTGTSSTSKIILEYIENNYSKTEVDGKIVLQKK
jgi:hypothetical protein